MMRWEGNRETHQGSWGPALVLLVKLPDLLLPSTPSEEEAQETSSHQAEAGPGACSGPVLVVRGRKDSCEGSGRRKIR